MIRQAARAARQGATLAEIVARADAFLGSEQAIDLGFCRWTTPEMLALERQVVVLASQPVAAPLRADPAAVSAAIASRPSLSAEQRTMVTELCGSGRPVEVVIGHAGAGKTFSLDAVRDAFEASGHRVIGTSLAARAALELQASAGIRSVTAHTLLAGINAGRVRLGPGDTLVVNEAGMVGTRQLAALAAETARAGAKLILVGDPRQLPPVEAGGLFASLGERVPVIELAENRRQVDPEERAITAALRRGQAELAVQRLDAHGRLTVAHNSDALRDQLVLDWWEHRSAGRDVVMGGVHREDVRDLNFRAHALLETSGQLGPVVAEVDGRRFCVGDQVRALRNRYDLGILNGQVGEVTGADRDRLCVRVDGRDVRLPVEYAAAHLDHSYARTVHKTQGLTCDVALLLGDDTLYAELGYTGLTRGRAENHLYTVVSAADAEGDGLDRLTRALATSRAKTAAVDYLEPPVRA